LGGKDDWFLDGADIDTFLKIINLHVGYSISGDLKIAHLWKWVLPKYIF
jgi:hypothetical protein